MISRVDSTQKGQEIHEEVLDTRKRACVSELGFCFQESVKPRILERELEGQLDRQLERQHERKAERQMSHPSWTHMTCQTSPILLDCLKGMSLH